MIVSPFLFLSIPSDRMFYLYHTSMEPASNVDKEIAVGLELIRRGRSVTAFLVDWYVFQSGQLLLHFEVSIPSHHILQLSHTSIKPDIHEPYECSIEPSSK